ncbi:hypothetical protein BJ742DRAFT_875077 [Cladochytrium replicatum]|nr:hypothetical protein BJ742DRAFT_875077 [Cladochytrium replicatum]
MKPSQLSIFPLFALALFVGSANAFYELTRPVPRGLDGNQQKYGPCGGFNSTQANRVSLSSLNGTIDVQLYWDGNVEIFLGFGENLTVFPYKLGQKLNATRGTKYEIPLNYSALPFDLIKLNANVTLQTVCHFSPTVDLFQCADLRVDVEGDEILKLQSNGTVRVIGQKPTGTTTLASTATSTVKATSTSSAATSAIKISGLWLLSVIMLCLGVLDF